MGQIFKFFGWLVVGIALTLVIFGHLTMILIYDMDYLFETLFPTDSENISSIWFILGSVVPGGTLWLLGHISQIFERKAAAKEALEAEAAEQSSISD